MTKERILFPSHKIYLSPSQIENAGRGVFAKVHIKKDEEIEQCPVIEIPPHQVEFIRQTEIYNYFFSWGKDFKQAAITLGFGSLYNHSYTPNATYVKRFKNKLITFVAIKDIEKDEEITVNYNHGNPDDKSPLWIKSIKPYLL